MACCPDPSRGPRPGAARTGTGTSDNSKRHGRLALARVLLAGFPVVILDEPAEHLDTATAGELTRDLLAAVSGRTVLLITHRPVAPGSVDQILRLERGRLVRRP